MLRDGIFVTLLFLLLPLSVQANVVVYENDFSSDPDWATDQPDNFFWSTPSSSLSIKIENASPAYEPNRYFLGTTTINPNEDWQLTWEMQVEEETRYGAYVFGLFSPDYVFNNRTFRTPILSESTVNLTLLTNNDLHNGVEFNIVSSNQQELGGTTLTSEFFEVGRWYVSTIIYDSASSTMKFVVTDKASSTVVQERQFDLPTGTTFSPQMQQLGASFYPGGTPGSTHNTPRAQTHHAKYQVDNVLLEQITDEEPEPDPLSERLLQYEPILYFHPDEEYFPMNVEAFVEGSGLWDSRGLLPDQNLIPRGEDNELTLDTLATSTDTEDWYINFSSDEAGEFDLAAARNRYQELVTSGKATSTYYAYEMTDSYTDELGKTHEFIVLQYWYFYAMNNWGEQGGFNNHEGDWESVFIFLDADTEEPLYAAFSAHHNDGFDELLNVTQYESVRRNWDDVSFDNGYMISYVALGAHAKYSNEVNREIFTPAGLREDQLSDAGLKTSEVTWNSRQSIDPNSFDWTGLYLGKWGTDKTEVGSAGPLGPAHAQLISNNEIRMLEPVKWAGIDQILEYEVDSPIGFLDFGNANVTMRFVDALDRGDVVAVDPYQEFISFGTNLDEIDLLPRYYDFSTNLENGTFEVEVTLTYSDEELAELGLFESELAIWFYNEETDTWEAVDSIVDPVANTISFTTDHFSVYTIGVLPEEPDTSELEVEYRWGSPYLSSTTRSVGVSFSNNTGQTLDEPLTLHISNIDPDAVTLLDYDRQDSFGYYVDIEPQEYGKCFFNIKEEQLPTDISQSDRKRILEDRPCSCREMVDKYPGLSTYLTHDLRPGKNTKSTPLKFRIGEGYKRFDFKTELLLQTISN